MEPSKFVYVEASQQITHSQMCSTSSLKVRRWLYTLTTSAATFEMRRVSNWTAYIPKSGRTLHEVSKLDICTPIHSLFEIRSVIVGCHIGGQEMS
jgi:hypothetical protein